MQGNLKKMRTRLDDPVTYELPLSDQAVPLNPLIGRKICLRYTGTINCIHCNRKINKSFNQGFCYPCFTSLAQCDMCIVKPELCHYASGTCREPEWGEKHCMIPHYVYLANSSGLKVGITRHTQIPTRWIDQGAVQALPVLKVTSRYVSGLVEVSLAKHVSDKTSWQKMLKNQVELMDMHSKRDALIIECRSELATVAEQFDQPVLEELEDETITEIHYPVLEYPSKVKSFNFDKSANVEGVLMGIKGQYLIFDTGVINIRKFGGYEVELTT